MSICFYTFVLFCFLRRAAALRALSVARWSGGHAKPGKLSALPELRRAASARAFASSRARIAEASENDANAGNRRAKLFLGAKKVRR